MHEIVANLHMHTPYSDGYGTHAEIAREALAADLDAVIVTDHNVLVRGPEGYYKDGQKRVLMIIGEEVHDRTRRPQKSHLLVLGMDREVAPLAEDLPQLLGQVGQAGALAFLAHPIEYPGPAIGEPDISWVDWGVTGYTGIEVWNALSEFKSLLKTKTHAVFYAFNPHLATRGPFEKTLRKWDGLLGEGRRVVAIGSSDAHAIPVQLGPVRRVIFPYGFHFRGVNTHLLLPQPLSGEGVADQDLILDALRQGHAFIGYDLPSPTRGFRFTAQGRERLAWMGDEVSGRHGVTFQVRLPRRAECRLLKDGQVIKKWRDRETCTHITTEAGVYRVEVYLAYRGRRRGWIFSNPIYVN